MYTGVVTTKVKQLDLCAGEGLTTRTRVYIGGTYEGWNFNSGNYLFTTDTKQIHVSKFSCPSM